MKSRKNTSKRGGATSVIPALGGPIKLMGKSYDQFELPTIQAKDTVNGETKVNVMPVDNGLAIGFNKPFFKHTFSPMVAAGKNNKGGSKKKCPKHCRRKTRRTRKGLKHRKN